MNPTIKELFDLSGKVALVTGGVGSLGTPICEALAESGSTVIAVDYNREKVVQTVDLFKKNGLSIEGIVSDVMSEESLTCCLDKIESKYGRLDILINSAYSGPRPELDSTGFDDYDLGLHNGPGAYGIASKLAVECMRKTGGGSIINIGSMYGVVTGYPEVYEGLTPPNPIVYQAGKAAIIQMTKYMAVYWAKYNIRVNCVSPGPFPYDSLIKEIPEFGQRLSQKVPMGRLGKPWEIKGVVLMLASDASSYITGQNILVDGGWTAW